MTRPLVVTIPAVFRLVEATPLLPLIFLKVCDQSTPN
jgi:hypothetical protein